MKLIFKKYQNKVKDSEMFGKWYGRVVINESVSIEDIALKMQDNCTVKRADILAVLSELGPTMRDLLQDSKRVTIPYLGSFKLSISTGGANSAKEFNIKEQLKRIKVIFQPETKTTPDGRRVKELTDNCRLAEAGKYDVPEDESQNP